MLTILILMVFVIVGLLFQYDRQNLLLFQFGYAKTVELQALRGSLQLATRAERPELLRRFAEQYSAQIFEERRRVISNAPLFVPVTPEPDTGIDDVPQDGEPVEPSPEARALAWRPFNHEGSAVEPNTEPEVLSNFRSLEKYLKEQLGESTIIRIQPDGKAMWVHFGVGQNRYWAGFPMPKDPQIQDMSSRAIFLALIVIGFLVIFAFSFARYLTQPLAKLAQAVNMVGRGEYPKPLGTGGPSELAALNRGFNAMTNRLRQVDADRAMLLAGVSHDLRTPLARMRISIEMNVSDDIERDYMIEDIDAIDRIIDQFLEFSRADNEAKALLQNANPLISACVARFQRNGFDVRFTPDPDLPKNLLRTTSFERLINNLVNNAINHGRPPIEITTGHDGKIIWICVRDHGQGFPREERNRLKEPFRRADAARTTAEGKLGAGLGLAIVDRIVRLHHGKFDLLDAEGGGGLVKVMMPRPPD
jgi:two-component system osmolarity sensor histidine kinase EnvZ